MHTCCKRLIKHGRNHPKGAGGACIKKRAAVSLRESQGVSAPWVVRGAVNNEEAEKLYQAPGAGGLSGVALADEPTNNQATPSDLPSARQPVLGGRDGASVPGNTGCQRGNVSFEESESLVPFDCQWHPRVNQELGRFTDSCAVKRCRAAACARRGS
jgi:hypothetical protein